MYGYLYKHLRILALFIKPGMLSYMMHGHRHVHMHNFMLQVITYRIAGNFQMVQISSWSSGPECGFYFNYRRLQSLSTGAYDRSISGGIGC